MNRIVYIFGFFIPLLPITMLSQLFDHDFASYAVQKGDFQEAEERLNRTLVDDHQNPKVLYDAGVVAYKKGNAEQARNYFDMVTLLDAVPDYQKEEALFNSGNASVNCGSLHEALEKYAAVLDINPENEYARHNEEIVRNMIHEQQEKEREQEQQKQERQQEQQKDQEKQQEEQQDKQQESNQDQNKNSSDDSEDKSEQEQSEKDQGQSPEGKPQEQHDKSDSDEKSGSGDKSRSGQEERQEQGDSDDAYDGDKEDHLEDRADEKEHQQSQKDDDAGKHDGPQKQSAETNTQAQHYQDRSVGSEKKQDSGYSDALGTQLAAFLEQLEKNDEQTNAKLAHERAQRACTQGGCVNGW